MENRHRLRFSRRNLLLLNGDLTFARKKLQIAYFSQLLTDQLNATQALDECITQRCPRFTEKVVRAHLARFGLKQPKSDTLIRNL